MERAMIRTSRAKLLRVLVSCGAMFATGVASAQQPAGAVSNPVVRAESSDIQWTEPQLQDFRLELSQWLTTPLHRTTDWKRLLAVVNDSSRPVVFRVAVWHVLVEQGGADEADSVLREVAACLSRVEAAIANPQHRAAQVFEYDFVRSFLPSDSTAQKKWLAIYAERAGIEEILRRAYDLSLYSGCGSSIHERAGVDIVGLADQLSETRRSRFAEESLRASPKNWTVDTRIADLVSPSGLVRLRTALASSNLEKPETVPASYAFTLAHRGDGETKAILARLIAEIESPPAGEIAGSSWRKEFRSRFRAFVKMIDAQRDVQGLSTLIGDVSDLSGYDAWLREWALSRGTQLGYDKDAMRQAFLTYGKAVLGAAQKPKQRPSLEAPSVGVLRGLRDRARVLGVLTIEDLAELPPPPPAP